MRVFRNEISVERGENFTLDMLIQNKDGSPFIISSELENPYFLLTISSCEYDIDSRIIKRYWCPISDLIPRFRNTSPALVESFESIKSPQSAVYYTKDSNSVCTYKYFKDNKWLPYECRYVNAFRAEDTINWIPQQYLYELKLLSGGVNPEYNKTGIPIIDYNYSQVLLPQTKFTVTANMTIPYMSADYVKVSTNDIGKTLVFEDGKYKLI